MTSIDAGLPPEEVPPHVVRWLAGEATPEERAEADRWLEAEPERRMRFALMERLWRTARGLPSPARVDRMWEALAHEMRAPWRTPPSSRRRGRHPVERVSVPERGSNRDRPQSSPHAEQRCRASSPRAWRLPEPPVEDARPPAVVLQLTND
jgi:hypothetical protein